MESRRFFFVAQVVLSVSPKHGAIVEWPTSSSFKVALKVGATIEGLA